MRIVVQRSKNGKVIVKNKIVGAIRNGLVLLVGVTQDDTEEDVHYMADKIVNLRIFEDMDGKMNQSILDVEGSILSVSQFTLYADTRKGRRPSYIDAAKPEYAQKLYDLLNEVMRQSGVTVETGVFGAMMDVQFTNDGPVTIILDSDFKKVNQEA